MTDNATLMAELRARLPQDVYDELKMTINVQEARMVGMMRALQGFDEELADLSSRFNELLQRHQQFVTDAAAGECGTELASGAWALLLEDVCAAHDMDVAYVNALLRLLGVKVATLP